MRTGRPVSSMALVALLALASPAQTLAAAPSPQASAPIAASPEASGPPGALTFATPEDAIRQYLSGVVAGDVSTILEASAADQIGSRFDFTANAERLGAIQPLSGLSPTEYPLFADMDRTFAAAQILSQARVLVYSLLTTEKLDGSVIAPVDQARAQAFVQQVDPAHLAGLTVMDIRYPNAKLEHDPRNVKNEAAEAAIYGADELTERVALISLGGNLDEVGFTLLRYGDDWRIIGQSSPLANLPASGAAVPITLDDYTQATSGE